MVVVIAHEWIPEVDPLLFCDVETLGLDERHHQLCEVGLILTDSNLRVVAEKAVVVGDPHVRCRSMNDYVREMHEASGLFDDVERSTLSLAGAEEELLAWVDEHDARGLYMAGSGVSFDRRWLRHHMARLAEVWHYRNFDLTTLRRFFGTEKRPAPHRALPDLRINVEDMRRFVRLRDRAFETVAGAA